MTKRAVDQLRHLLEVERSALLAGDLVAVGALIAEKEALAQKIEASNPLELRLLSAQLMRNGALLSAARQGVETVLNTLQLQRAARTSLSSYDSNGQATRISRTTGQTERRF